MDNKTTLGLWERYNSLGEEIEAKEIEINILREMRGTTVIQIGNEQVEKGKGKL